MSLFDQVLSAVSNPEQLASSEQLSGILGTVQQLAGEKGLDANATQAIMSVVGQQVRSSLKDQQAAGGLEQVEGLINQFAGSGASPEALSSLFSPEKQAQVAQMVAERTGLPQDQIQSMLPTLVPLALNVLKSGAPAAGGTSQNSVLNAFLDADGDGDVDMGDMMAKASQFM